MYQKEDKSQPVMAIFFEEPEIITKAHEYQQE
jgi:hypothetical protein